MADKDNKPACKYGVNCYQRNQPHKDKFSHPPKVSTNADNGSVSPSQPPPKKRRSKSPPKESENESLSDNENENESQSENESKNESGKEDGNESGKEDGNESGKEDGNESGKEDGKESDKEDGNESGKEDRNESGKEDGNESMEPEKIDSGNGNSLTSNIESKEAKAGSRCSEFIMESFDKGPHNQRVEHKQLLESPAEFIRAKFLVEMPSDFFTFWEFYESEFSKKSPSQNLFAKLGIKLVGPFDVLAKKFHDIEPFEPGDYLRHWRFYYDPPEFQTILVKEKTGIHYGYWRDEPSGECLIARNDVTKNCEFTFIADNVFGAVLSILEKDTQVSLFNKPAALALKKSIEDFARAKNISLTSLPASLKSRNLKTVCKTFHKAGLVVPYNRKTDIGYRTLGESDANLKKILNKITEAKGNKELIASAMDHLQPLITAANIACDESDFGSVIELGMDLFCFGAPELHTSALQLVVIGYKMVNKPQFIAIIKAHLEKRTNGFTGLSILENVKQTN